MLQELKVVISFSIEYIKYPLLTWQMIFIYFPLDAITAVGSFILKANELLQ